MNMTKTSYGSRPTILAADDYTAVPFHNDSSALVKAGEVLEDFDGNNTGVALYDIPRGENGAMVVAGVIDVVKAAKAAGVEETYYDNFAANYPALHFRKGIKNQEV